MDNDKALNSCNGNTLLIGGHTPEPKKERCCRCGAELTEMEIEVGNDTCNECVRYEAQEEEYGNEYGRF